MHMWMYMHLQICSMVAFSQTLRRYTSLNHLAQAARAVLQNPSQISQMLNDLNRVDFANVQVSNKIIIASFLCVKFYLKRESECWTLMKCYQLLALTLCLAPLHEQRLFMNCASWPPLLDIQYLEFKNLLLFLFSHHQLYTSKVFHHSVCIVFLLL